MPDPCGWRRIHAAVLVLGSVVLGGCVATGPRYAQPSDACYAHRTALDAAGQGFADQLASGGSGKADAYWKARRAATRDHGRLARAVAKDLEAEVKRLGAVRAAFGRLMDCRRGQAAEIRAAWSAGTMGRWEAQAALDELADAVGAEAALADDIGLDLDRRAEQLAYACGRLNPGSTAKLRARALRRAASPGEERHRPLPAETGKAAERLTERLLEGRERFRLARAAASDPTLVTGRLEPPAG